MADSIKKLDVMLRDPRWIFVSWVDDFFQDRTSHYWLRLLQHTADKPVIGYDVRIRAQTRSWYMLLPAAETHYSVELWSKTEDGQPVLEAVSDQITSPAWPQLPEQAVARALMKLSSKGQGDLSSRWQ